jgi:superfamily I DNA and/or RNA helicase
MLFSNAGDPELTVIIDFDVVVVDEASKATESDIWNMIAYYNPGMYILVGDEK